MSKERWSTAPRAIDRRLKMGPRASPQGLAQGLCRHPETTDAHAGDLRGAAVEFTLGHGGQLLIRRFFLVEVLLKQSRAIVPPELLCPRNQRTVARNLIVLDRLGRGDQRGIQDRLVLDF